MQDSGLTDNSRIACIINPYAANKRWQRNKLLRKYVQKRLPGKYIDTQKGKENTIEKAKELCRNHDVIVAAGGDGTIADVIQGIMESDRSGQVALGVIPLGSGNAFRISLDIPLSVSRSLKIIQGGKIKKIDLIQIEDKVATFGSVGATAQVLVEKLKHTIPGFLGHILASRIMTRLSRKRQEIDLYDGIDDTGNHFKHKNLKLKVFDCFIGKSRHFGYGWKMAPEARIDDGYVDATFFEISSLKFMLYFPGIYFGTFQKTQPHYKAKRMVIKGSNLPVQYNGELLGKRDQVEIKILPKALNVICPL
jgi:diacylglycerol kinase (ATP)